MFSTDNLRFERAAADDGIHNVDEIKEAGREKH